METTKTKTSLPSYGEQVKALKEQMKKGAPAEILSIYAKEAEELEQSDIAKYALQPGTKAPLFTLPDAVGNSVSLAHALENGNVVLSFYRGPWCPYCNLQLKIYQEILPQIKALGATLITVSPNTPDHSLSMKEKHALTFDVLSDFDNATARLYNIVFTQADNIAELNKKFGADLTVFNGVAKREIPLPATFIIGKDGIIKYTFAHGDYTKRIEPKQVLDVLGTLK